MEALASKPKQRPKSLLYGHVQYKKFRKQTLRMPLSKLYIVHQTPKTAGAEDGVSDRYGRIKKTMQIQKSISYQW